MSYQGEILLETGTNELEIVEFMIHHPEDEMEEVSGHYGINVAKVREILTVPEILEYPNAHPAFAGAINLRGKVISVVDLGRWLGVETKRDKKSRVIVTEINGIVTGFIVDAVERIHRISWSQVDAPPAQLPAFAGSCVTSVVRMESRIILLLDFETILMDINPSLLPKTTIVPLPEGLQRTGKRVVIAEDSASIRRMMTHVLSEAGYTVTAYDNGEGLLNWIMDKNRLKEDLPDLIISDIEMPRVDGFHLLARLKATEGIRHVPTVLYSSMGSDVNKAKALRLGALDLISKPDLPNLLHMVDEIFLGKWSR